jgi:hypothetical protein
MEWKPCSHGLPCRSVGPLPPNLHRASDVCSALLRELQTALTQQRGAFSLAVLFRNGSICAMDATGVRSPRAFNDRVDTGAMEPTRGCPYDIAELCAEIMRLFMARAGRAYFRDYQRGSAMAIQFTSTARRGRRDPRADARWRCYRILVGLCGSSM